MRSLGFASLLTAIVASSCGGGRPGPYIPEECVPGQSVACVGPGGCQGGQVCRSDGAGYEPCVCAATSDAGTRPDAARDVGPAADAARDASARPDARRHDAAARDAGDCSQCGPLACCDGMCIDTSTDTANCGTCGHRCYPGRAPDCVLGVCGCFDNSGQACSPAETCCTGGCRNLASDPLNCGACGRRCATGETCMNGACSCGGTMCASPRICCNGACVDPRTDNNHCGSCTNQCVNGNICQNGLCQGGQNTCNGTTCPSGQQCCPDVCCTLCVNGNFCLDDLYGDGGAP